MAVLGHFRLLKQLVGVENLLVHDGGSQVSLLGPAACPHEDRYTDTWSAFCGSRDSECRSVRIACPVSPLVGGGYTDTRR